MVDLILFKDNTYTAKVLNEKVLNDVVGSEISAVIMPILQEHDLITIELNDISRFEGEGYNVLSDLFRLSVANNCMLRFTNVHDDIFELIDAFSYDEEG